MIPHVPQQTTPRQPLYKTHSDSLRPTYTPQGGSRPSVGQGVGRPALGVRKTQSGIPQNLHALDRRPATLPNVGPHLMERAPIQTQGSSSVPVISSVKPSGGVLPPSVVSHTTQKHPTGIIPGQIDKEKPMFNLNTLKVKDVACSSGEYSAAALRFLLRKRLEKLLCLAVPSMTARPVVQQTCGFPATFLTRGPITPLGSQPITSSGFPATQVGETCATSSCFVVPPSGTCAPPASVVPSLDQNHLVTSTKVTNSSTPKADGKAETAVVCVDKEHEKKG